MSHISHLIFRGDIRLAFIANPGERLDDLVRDGMRILQRPDQFCFSIDSVLLAHFVRIHRKDAIIDLGTGTGVIPLLLTAFGARDVTGIERNPIMADLAKRNVEGNRKGGEIRIVEGDYCQAGSLFSSGSFTAAVVNPPYREMGTGRVNAKSGVAAACHELTASLSDVFKTVRYLLAYGGRLYMVHRADRFCDLVSEGRAYGMEMKRVRFIASHEGEQAVRVLAEWKYGGRPDLTVEPPLIVHEADGSYTKEVNRIYGKENGNE